MRQLYCHRLTFHPKQALACRIVVCVEEYSDSIGMLLDIRHLSIWSATEIYNCIVQHPKRLVLATWSKSINVLAYPSAIHQELDSPSETAIQIKVYFAIDSSTLRMSWSRKYLGKLGTDGAIRWSGLCQCMHHQMLKDCFFWESIDCGVL